MADDKRRWFSLNELTDIEVRALDMIRAHPEDEAWEQQCKALVGAAQDLWDAMALR